VRGYVASLAAEERANVAFAVGSVRVLELVDGLAFVDLREPQIVIGHLGGRLFAR
jgi:hypothetical protein